MFKRLFPTCGRFIPFWAAAAIAMLCLAASPASALAAKATPSSVVKATPSQVTVGELITVGFDLSGGEEPAGTVELIFYEAGGCEFQGSPFFTVNVTGDGSSFPGGIGPIAAGTKSFRAVYSGDAGNEP